MTNLMYRCINKLSLLLIQILGIKVKAFDGLMLPKLSSKSFPNIGSNDETKSFAFKMDLH